MSSILDTKNHDEEPILKHSVNEFREAVIATVCSIPAGKVASYGKIAELAGNKRAARQVGMILKSLPSGGKVPWYRVVNHKGEISLSGTDYQRQFNELIAEGIQFRQVGERLKILNIFFI